MFIKRVVNRAIIFPYNVYLFNNNSIYFCVIYYDVMACIFIDADRK